MGLFSTALFHAFAADLHPLQPEFLDLKRLQRAHFPVSAGPGDQFLRLSLRHSRSVPSREPDRIEWPSGRESQFRDCIPVSAEGSQHFPGACMPQPHGPIPEPEIRRLPLALKATLVTVPSCSRNIRSVSPVAASHKRNVPSQEPERTGLPSGLNDAPITCPMCPGKPAASHPLPYPTGCSVRPWNRKAFAAHRG